MKQFLSVEYCDEKIFVFGKSHIEEIAQQYHIPVLGRIPMDPALATACDEGRIEFLENDYMKDAMEVIRHI